MNYIKLAKEIREKYHKYLNTSQHLLKEYEDCANECKHSKVIIIYTAYSGSYSHDYDDSHGEMRMCLVCGVREYAEKKEEFKVLVNPFARFSFSGTLNRDENFEKSPIGNMFDYKLSELVKWCNENGFKV